jgi:hypothetical protein
MKLARAAILAAVTLGVTGCVTHSVIEKAKPPQTLQPRKNAKEYRRAHPGVEGVLPVSVPVEGARGHPGYYALLPLAVPVDIATSPLQLAAMIFIAGTFTGWR